MKQEQRKQSTTPKSKADAGAYWDVEEGTPRKRNLKCIIIVHWTHNTAILYRMYY
jgi:hypothetical protein